ncbi:MAG: hypothetical protein J7M40_16990, partial [Planctomycetes bacterium]|nr:hypothetical protein [Planctomycetota bacterium]
GLDWCDATIRNSVIWGNGNWQIIWGSPSIEFSNVEGGWEGQGNIDVDPMFADADSGEYHLKSEAGRWDPVAGQWAHDPNTSPCIDGGDPNSNWHGEYWPHGGRINMGAYGGTKYASMSCLRWAMLPIWIMTGGLGFWILVCLRGSGDLIPLIGGLRAHPTGETLIVMGLLGWLILQFLSRSGCGRDLTV